MAVGTFDLRLIPEFDGSDRGLSIVEWFGNTELVCDLCDEKNVARVHQKALIDFIRKLVDSGLLS